MPMLLKKVPGTKNGYNIEGQNLQSLIMSLAELNVRTLILNQKTHDVIDWRHFSRMPHITINNKIKDGVIFVNQWY